jgi:hypothetical protein
MNIYRKFNIVYPTERQFAIFVNGLSIIAIVLIAFDMWRNLHDLEWSRALAYFGMIAFCLLVGYWKRCGNEVYRAFMLVRKCIGFGITNLYRRCRWNK